MKKELEMINIALKPDAEYSEVVDSVADFFNVGIIIEDALEDGFQFKDLFALLQVEPLIQEIVTDVPIFLEQFLQLNQDTSLAAILEARQRILSSGKTFGRFTQYIARFLFLAANNYSYAAETYMAGEKQYRMWQTFVQGGEIFPDGPVS